jgi:hypothetical protein
MSDIIDELHMANEFLLPRTLRAQTKPTLTCERTRCAVTLHIIHINH